MKSYSVAISASKRDQKIFRKDRSKKKSIEKNWSNILLYHESEETLSASSSSSDPDDDDDDLDPSWVIDEREREDREKKLKEENTKSHSHKYRSTRKELALRQKRFQNYKINKSPKNSISIQISKEKRKSWYLSATNIPEVDEHLDVSISKIEKRRTQSARTMSTSRDSMELSLHESFNDISSESISNLVHQESLIIDVSILEDFHNLAPSQLDLIISENQALSTYDTDSQTISDSDTKSLDDDPTSELNSPTTPTCCFPKISPRRKQHAVDHPNLIQANIHTNSKSKKLSTVTPPIRRSSAKKIKGEYINYITGVKTTTFTRTVSYRAHPIHRKRSRSFDDGDKKFIHDKKAHKKAKRTSSFFKRKKKDLIQKQTNTIKKDTDNNDHLKKNNHNSKHNNIYNNVVVIPHLQRIPAYIEAERLEREYSTRETRTATEDQTTELAGDSDYDVCTLSEEDGWISPGWDFNKMTNSTTALVPKKKKKKKKKSAQKHVKSKKKVSKQKNTPSPRRRSAGAVHKIKRETSSTSDDDSGVSGRSG